MRTGPRIVLLTWCGVVFALVLAPLLVIVIVSFGPSENYQFPPTGFTLDWYADFFESSRYLDAFFKVSLLVALLCAFISTIIGTAAAIGVYRFRFFGRGLVELLFLAPLITPQVLLGAAIYLFYVRLGASPSMLTLLCAHVAVATPYVMRSVAAGLAGLNPSLEEAAMSLGATRIQAFFKAALPLLRSSLLSGAVFAFIVSLSDINLALFLSGPNSVNLPLQILGDLQMGGTPVIAAASSIQIVLIGGLILIVQRLFRLKSVI